MFDAGLALVHIVNRHAAQPQMGHRGPMPTRISSRERLRIDRAAQHLHTLGPRAVAEVIAGIAFRCDGLPETLAVLEETARFDRALLAAVGGTSFPRRLRAAP